MKKTCAERRKISLLKDLKIRKQFEEKVIKFNKWDVYASKWAEN